MVNNHILSPKPSIDEALEFLGMSNMDKTMAIQALLRISEIDDLPLFFDEHLTCVPTSIRYGDQFDENNEFVKTLLIDSKDEQEFMSGNTLDSFHLFKDTGSILYLLVNKIKQNGISYYISQSDRTISEGVTIRYEKFYFDRKQLIEYKTEHSSHLSDRHNSKSPSSKRASIQDMRVKAFKYWLVGNSGKSIHSNEDLQNCYESLGALTRKKIWNRLQKMDKKLFAAGEADFFKAASSVITFKQGTGKDRPR